MAIDLHRLGEITARVRDSIDEARDRIWQLAGGEFTIGSPQQLGEVLFTSLGLPPGRKGKTGYSTDARVLRGLRGQHAIVPLIEEWRELTKLLNTYLDAAADLRQPRDAGACTRPSTRRWPAPGGFELQPQPAEHPRAHRAGQPHPRVLRGRRRAAG